MGFLSDHMNNKMEMDEVLREYEAAKHPMNVYRENADAIDYSVNQTGYARAHGPIRPQTPRQVPIDYSRDIYEFKVNRVGGKDVLFGRNLAEATNTNPGWLPVA